MGTNASTTVPVRKRVTVTLGAPGNVAIPDSEKYRTFIIQWQGATGAPLVKLQGKAVPQAAAFQDLNFLDTVHYSGDVTGTTGMILLDMPTTMPGGLNINCSGALTATASFFVIMSGSAHTVTPR
jgi:hypothetical protein